METAARLDLLRLYGSSPESFCLVYDAPWRAAAGGAVSYLESHRTAVVWGDPLAAPADRAAALRAATAELRGQGLRVCLVLVSRETAATAIELGYTALKIGEQPTFELGAWQLPRGNRGKHLRWALNRARREGLEVTEDGGDGVEVAQVVAEWEEALGRPAARSFLQASPLTAVGEKRLFHARRNGRLEALLACAPVYGERGWFLEDLVRRPEAPAGATELLVVAALAHLAADGFARAWLDLAPLRGRGDQLDRRAERLLRLAAPLLAVFDHRYRFEAMAAYPGKFVPSAWTPRYVAILPPWPTPSLLRGIRASLAA